jgi:phosphatidylglycerophosphatase A
MKADRAGLLATTLATWFGCGYAPFAPGTFGSLGALVPAVLLARAGWRPLYFVALAVAALPVAVWSAHVTAKRMGKEDPPQVVIDEVVGQWIALGGAVSAKQIHWPVYLAAFGLFRLMDIWKPAPARQLERLPGGYGIVADDVIAGIYAALVLWAAGCFNLY